MTYQVTCQPWHSANSDKVWPERMMPLKRIFHLGYLQQQTRPWKLLPKLVYVNLGPGWTDHTPWAGAVSCRLEAKAILFREASTLPWRLWDWLDQGYTDHWRNSDWATLPEHPSATPGQVIESFVTVFFFLTCINTWSWPPQRRMLLNCLRKGLLPQIQ